MFQVLHQPFPYTVQITQRIRTALTYGLFVFLFLLLFRPFGLNELPKSALVHASALYGLVCFAILCICFLLLPALLPVYYSEAGWKVWKEILHTVGCVLAVAMGNIALTHYLFHEAFSAGLVLRFLWITGCVSIFPIGWLVLLRQNRLMRAFSRQAAELDKHLAPPEAVTAVRQTDPIGESFLYAEAADNYVKIYYSTSGKVRHELVRGTLRQTEQLLRDQLPASNRIYRCHRTYLVNLDQVVHISGNAQGYKLHLPGTGQVIPVSRSLNGEIAAFVVRPKRVPPRPNDQ